ncbi:MAG: DUF2268 domain-containing putative Zn-dependent protease [Dyella sp.]|uniref:DUF2268 domain-containing putative Zn-dependent protease n=1 Tax=Dyella sp. TaxID=1869338 RepID=UPI003F7F5398
MLKPIFDRRCVLSGAERSMVEQICSDTSAELRTMLPTLPREVRVHVATHGRVIPQVGVGARAVTRKSMAFVIAPDHPSGSTRLIQKYLRPTMFHECHHMIRGWVMRGGKRRRRFIDGVIHEGLATAFERDAAGHASPWADYPADIQSWIDELLPLPVYVPYAKWMFAHPDGRRWIGYRAGVCIADRAIAASGRSAAELAETPAEEVLALAGLSLPPIQRWRSIFRHPLR